MDNKMLISMMGTTSRDGASSTSKGAEVDADAFSQAFEKATSGRGTGANQSESVIAEKGTRKSDTERRKDEANQAAAQASDPKLQDPKALGSRAYLYHLMYKNPDAMSLAEKQALKMDAGTRDGVGLRDLRKMMQDRGLNMRELTFSQMADLTRSNSRARVDSFLDHLAKEKNGERDDPRVAGTGTTDASLAASSTRAEAGPNRETSMAAAALRQAGQAAPSQENAKAQRRREVIDQIVQHMELRNLANRDELQLKLNPEYLGELKIQLVQGESGEVSARFLTTSEETREVLSESRSDLRKRVEDRGVRLGAIDVDLVDSLV